MLFELIICLLASYLLWKVYFRGSKTDPPMLSRKLPIIGHCHLLMGGSSGIFNGIKELSEDCLEKGGTTLFYLGLRSVYGLTDPEDTLAVTNACLKKDNIYSFAKPFLGDGLVVGSDRILLPHNFEITADDSRRVGRAYVTVAFEDLLNRNAEIPTWKKHRKLINPAFNQQVLNSFVGVFNSQGRKLIEQFMNEVGKPFDHEHLLRLNNLETICITATGVGSEEYNAAQKEYLPVMGRILVIMTERFQKFWLHPEFIFGLSNLKKKQDEVVKTLLNLSTSIVQQRKKEMQTKLLNGTFEIEKNQSGKPKAFMDLILELANNTNCFTDEEIREETDNIVAGGHDTSATHLTFTFLVLGSYPEVQQKVYDEIIRVLGPEDRDLDKEDISKLVYIDAVLKETLRLYPIAPFIARYLEKDIKLRNYTLKADSGCYIFVYGLHRHAMWGSDANEFRPERWLDPSTLPDMNYFGGFGLGRRSCIGKVYAMMSMKTIVAHMLRRYRIKSDISQLKLGIDVMLRPLSGHHISIELRK